MKKRGFTLIELLVVISIIALLMAILVPAIAKSKNVAKSLICRSKLRDWGFYFHLYTSDNSGLFMESEKQKKIVWIQTMRPYHQDDPKKLLCPMAKQPAFPNADATKCFGSTFKAWGRMHPTYDEKKIYSSYGLNCWVQNEPRGQSWNAHDTDYNWRTIHIEGSVAHNVPLFLDCTWMGASPENRDTPPPTEAWERDIIRGGNNMERFCINRHDGYINGVFLDLGARKIGLKELWRLKWSRKFDTNTTQKYWPPWMRRFRNY